MKIPTVMIVFGLCSGIARASDYYSKRQEVAQKALPYAELSMHAYGKTIGENVVAGWNAVDYYNSPSGLQALVYQTQEKGKRTVVVFRGSDEAADWPGNVVQAAGILSSQYREGLAYTKVMKKKYGDIVVTGHSLGGGIAQYSAGKLGLEGWTFNPAGLGFEAQTRLGLSPIAEGKCRRGQCERITNVVSRGEVLDAARTVTYGFTTLAGTTVKFDFVKQSRGKAHDIKLLEGNLRAVADGSREPYAESRKPKKKHPLRKAKKRVSKKIKKLREKLQEKKKKRQKKISIRKKESDKEDNARDSLKKSCEQQCAVAKNKFRLALCMRSCLRRGGQTRRQ